MLSESDNAIIKQASLTCLLILDEIQECPRALTSLKYFCELMPEMAVCAAGSLLGIHLAQSSFPVGKVDYLKMNPMGFFEFLEGTDQTRYGDYLRRYTGEETIPEVVHKHLWAQLKIYFVVGGLPEIVSLYANNRADLYSAMKLVRERQSDLIRDYSADIAKHSGKQNAMHIERIWKNIPSLSTLPGIQIPFMGKRGHPLVNQLTI